MKKICLIFSSKKFVWACAFVMPFAMAIIASIYPDLFKSPDVLNGYNKLGALLFHGFLVLPSYIVLLFLGGGFLRAIKRAALFTLSLIVIVPLLWGYFIFSSCYVFNSGCL